MDISLASSGWNQRDESYAAALMGDQWESSDFHVDALGKGKGKSKGKGKGKTEVTAAGAQSVTRYPTL